MTVSKLFGLLAVYWILAPRTAVSCSARNIGTIFCLGTDAQQRGQASAGRSGFDLARCIRLCLRPQRRKVEAQRMKRQPEPDLALRRVTAQQAALDEQ